MECERAEIHLSEPLAVSRLEKNLPKQNRLHYRSVVLDTLLVSAEHDFTSVITCLIVMFLSLFLD